MGCALVYGVHRQWLLNVVVYPDGDGGIVLIRAMEPCDGLEVMANFMDIKVFCSIANSPGKLIKALMIGKGLHKRPLCTTDYGLWVEEGVRTSPSDVVKSNRCFKRPSSRVKVLHKRPSLCFQEASLYVLREASSWGNPHISK